MTRRRADAVLNRTKLLDAADATFLELGTVAPLDVIAERAGVGRATLFRNFADRDELMLGLIERSLEELHVEAARGGSDPGVLKRLLRLIANLITSRAPMVHYLRTLGHNDPRIVALRQRHLAVFEKPVAHAVAVGACRPDLVPSDIRLVVSLLSGVVDYGPEERREAAERAWIFAIEMLHLQDVPPSSSEIASQRDR